MLTEFHDDMLLCVTGGIALGTFKTDFYPMFEVPLDAPVVIAGGSTIGYETKSDIGQEMRIVCGSVANNFVR